MRASFQRDKTACTRTKRARRSNYKDKEKKQRWEHRRPSFLESTQRSKARFYCVGSQPSTKLPKATSHAASITGPWLYIYGHSGLTAMGEMESAVHGHRHARETTPDIENRTVLTGNAAQQAKHALKRTRRSIPNIYIWPHVSTLAAIVYARDGVLLLVTSNVVAHIAYRFSVLPKQVTLQHALTYKFVSGYGII